jgi:hypothetical protein
VIFSGHKELQREIGGSFNSLCHRCLRATAGDRPTLGATNGNS